MKRLLAGLGSGLLLLGAPLGWAQADASTADLMKIIQEQNRKIDALIQRVQQLESRPGVAAPSDTSQIKTVIMETNEALAQTNKDVEKLGKRLVLGRGIEGLRLTGDLRVRYEQREKDVHSLANNRDEDRTRFRTRFRLGGIWNNPSESWEVGAGLATGGTSGRSTNDTWGDKAGSVFETDNISLDYAYATHKWTEPFSLACLPGPVSLTLGQQRNPFVNTILTWDNDLRPVGFTAQYGEPMGRDYSGPFATAGAYLVQWLSDGKNKIGAANHNYLDDWDDNVWLYAAQVGWAQKLETFDWLALAGFHHVSSAYRNVNWTLDDFKNSDNPNNVSGAGDTGYDYNIGELYAEVKTSVKGIELKPYGHLVMNFGADGNDTQALGGGATDTIIDPKDENLGWMLGLDVKRGKWRVGYGYCHIGADAVFGPMRDSDFGETAGLVDTDIRGHKISVGYNPVKNLTLSATYHLLKSMEAGDADANNNRADKAQLLQLDAAYRF